MSIAERLKEERIIKGMTQKKLADIGGVSPKTQSFYETGFTNPDGKYLSRLCDSIDIYYVLTGSRLSQPKQVITKEQIALLRGLLYQHKDDPEIKKIFEGLTLIQPTAAASHK